MHFFRDNAVTGDIPLISLVLKSMVPTSYLLYIRPGLLGYTSSGCPNRLCSSPPLLGFYWGGGGWGDGWKWCCLRPQCLQFTNNTYIICPYTLKHGPGLGKILFPVLGDNRTLHAPAGSLNPTHPCDILTRIDFSMTWLIYHIKWFNMISNENMHSFCTYWNELIIQHYSTASWTTFHIFDGLSC